MKCKIGPSAIIKVHYNVILSDMNYSCSIKCLKILLLLPNLPDFTRGHHLLFQGAFESEPESLRNLCSIWLESSLPLPWNPFLQRGNLWKTCRKNSLQRRIDSFSNLYFLFRCSVPLILHFILHFDPKHGPCWVRGRVTSKDSNS